MDLEEYILILNAKSGIKEDFIKLIEKNITSLYRVSKGILKNEMDIEDSIQDTIILAYKNIKKLKKDEHFKTWLIRILINESNKIYKNNKKYVSIEKTNDSAINDNYSNLDLRDAIENLNEELRIPIILFYFEDLKLKDIASILDIPEGTVKSRLSRAKKNIVIFMNEEEDII